MPIFLNTNSSRVIWQHQFNGIHHLSNHAEPSFPFLCVINIIILMNYNYKHIWKLFYHFEFSTFNFFISSVAHKPFVTAEKSLPYSWNITLFTCVITMVQDNKQYLKIFFFNFNALSGPLDPNMINHNFIYIILSLYFSNEKKTLCSVSQSKATHTFHYQTIQYHGNISNFGQASDLSPPTFHDSGHIESKQEC